MEKLNLNKQLWAGDLAIGNPVELNVVSDRKKRSVFEATTHDMENGDYNPTMRIIHPSCAAALKLSSGETYQGKVKDIKVSDRLIMAARAERRVIYIYVEDLARVEEVNVYFMDGNLCRNVVSGSHCVSSESFPATGRTRNMIYNDYIMRIEEVFVADQLVMRRFRGVVDDDAFCEEQRQLLRGSSFNFAAFKRRMPVLSKEQHDSFDKLLVCWESVKNPPPEEKRQLAAESPTVESLKKLAASFGCHHQDGMQMAA